MMESNIAMRDVFISYSRKDMAVVDDICRLLDDEKISYWRDVKDIFPGETFIGSLTKAIENSRITLFISSRDSNQSIYTAQEVSLAFTKGKHIIPYKIDAEDFSKDLEFIFVNRNVFTAASPFEASNKKLVEGIKGILATLQPDPEPIPNPNTPTSEPSPSSQLITVGTVSFRMVRVEGGTFTMGATTEQSDDADDDEYPTHQVTLSSYWIGETEVTQLLWKEVMGNNPSVFQGNDLPVEMVSYDDVQEFIRRLNQRTGRRFRLPTEAEWEYAARGGRNSRGYKYSGSNDINDVAWYYDNSNNETHPVKQKRPNELGLYDMSGNVWEWCSDWYGDYSSTSQIDPRGAASGSRRVLRGGSWLDDAWGCRSSYRDNNAPGNRNDNSGFRLALSE